MKDEHTKGKPFSLEVLPTFLLSALVFLLPLFVIPSFAYHMELTKSTLMVIFVLVALIFWILQRLRDGVLTFPATPIFIAAVSLPVVYLIASIFSNSFAESFAGQGFEVGTTASLVLMAILFFLTSTLFRTKTSVLRVYIALIASFTLLALFHVSRLFFGANFLSFGFFTSNISSTLGKWNDLGIFFGLITILILLTTELLDLDAPLKRILYGILAVSLVLLMVVNFTTVWIVLAVFATMLFVYALSLARAKRRGQSDKALMRGLPIPTLIVLLMAMVFIFASGPLSARISSMLEIEHIEARPNWTSTLTVAKATVSKNLLFGAGPNRFAEQWALHKPADINATVFWNLDFNRGIGLLPTFLVTTGVAGLLAWLTFFAFFLYLGYRALVAARNDQLGFYLLISSFLLALYLWVFVVFYVPNIVLFGFAFFFTGLFVALLVQERVVETKSILFIEQPRTSFIVSLSLVILLISSLVGGYFQTRRFLAFVLAQKGITVFQQAGNTEVAEAQLGKAIRANESDLYYRFLSQVHIKNIDNLFAKTNITASEAQVQFQEFLGNAIASAERATEIDSSDYQNWVSLGRVYAAILPLGIDGAHANAKKAYERAIELNPNGPDLFLALARFEALRGDMEAARSYIAESLARKGNYTDAIFFLSQIEESEGNLEAAINSTEAASLLAPNDPAVFFQLGLLRYNNGDFTKSVAALERAVSLNAGYSNARYFLGLSYDALERTEEAIGQFVEIERLNPGNTEVTFILENLRAGRSPFQGAGPPISQNPEDREELPLVEAVF